MLNKRLLPLILLFLLLLFTIYGCKSFVEKSIERIKPSILIRIRLLYQDKVFITLTKDNILYNTDNNTIIPLFKKNDLQEKKKITIDLKEKTILLEDKPIDFPIAIYSQSNKLISLNSDKYFQVIKIIPHANEVLIINETEIDKYLASVLPSEILPYFHQEAIKAQSVAARTYAYLHLNKRNIYYDIDNSIRYQAYKGYNLYLNKEQQKNIENAIHSTTSQILLYNQKPIIAYFHSNSGGYTISGKDYFGDNSDYPYLSAHEDPYSLDTPGAKWLYEISINDFLKALNINIDISTDITVTTLDMSTDIVIDNTTDLSTDTTTSQILPKELISIENFNYNSQGYVDTFIYKDQSYSNRFIRKQLGYAKLKSERFKVEKISSGNLYLSGIGFGHGVGMSQWGANSMAEKGFNYREILSFYYPQTEIGMIPNEN